MTTDRLRILQIGAGSMGSRRLRDLQLDAGVELALYESRDDRRSNAIERFKVPTFSDLESALAWSPQALSISTPPDAHAAYVDLALERGLHHFCEANIWTPDWRKVDRISRDKRLVSAPSTSFHFNPLLAKLKRMIDSYLGSLHAVSFVISFYMPDWHPGEGAEFYARRRGTSAVREMVPFELLWLYEVFGPPSTVSGEVRQHGFPGDVLEDSWNLQIRLQSHAVLQLTVLMNSRASCRQGICVGDNGIIEFDVLTGALRCRLRDEVESDIVLGSQSDIIESVYRAEINAFVSAVRGEREWPLSYHDAAIATATLAASELSAASAMAETVDPDRQPAFVPSDYSRTHHDLDISPNRLAGPALRRAAGAGQTIQLEPKAS